MRKILFALVAFMMAYNVVCAQVNWDFSGRIDSLQNELTFLRKEMGSKDQRIKKLEEKVNKLEKDNSNLIELLSKTDSKFGEQIANVISKTETIIDSTKTELNTTLEANKQEADTSIGKVSIFGAVGIAFVLLLSALLFWLLRKRIGKGDGDLQVVKDANQKLTEQSVALDNRLVEMLERQLATDERVKAISAQPKASEVDHSLILSIANELTRIEQNLAFMDPATKGVSQLRNRAKAIAESLAAKGYEVVNLIGTEYKEGDNMEVVMEEDEDMEPGKMIIRRVNRPCVMYKDKMIQSPKVVVAYNPE